MIPGDVYGYDEYDEYGDDTGSGRQAQLMKFSGWISVDSQFTVSFQSNRAAQYDANELGRVCRCYSLLSAETPSVTVLTRRPSSSGLFSCFHSRNVHNAWHNVSFHTISFLPRPADHRLSRFVNADTLLSLQIIQSESHPNSHNQGPSKTSSGAKEGLSLYGLFHGLASTTQGRQMLRQCFLRPCTNLDLIKERLDTLTVFTRPDNEVGLAGICKHLRGVKNIRGLTAKLRKGAAGGTNKGSGIARGIWQGLQRVKYDLVPSN